MTAADISLDVLLIEDNPGDAQLVEHHLNAPHVADIVGDVTLTHEESLPDGLDELERASFDILFLDLGLSESTGLETLEHVLNEGPRIPIVVLTGLDDRETAVQSIQRGAQDYLLKDDIDPDTLTRALRYAVERHRQEEKLRRQNERLDKFVGVVSHDLRNPLNIAKGRAAMLQDDCDSSDLDDVTRALDRMETLIEDLLTLARQGDTIDTVASVDLVPLVRDCQRTVDTSSAEIITDTECAIYADENRFKQLLENLFRNAIEHNDAPVTITVGADGRDTLYVEDDGSGIPEPERDRVFEGGHSTLSDGTGFGLMIAEEIASAHGWTISVADSNSGGARFEITGVAVATE